MSSWAGRLWRWLRDNRNPPQQPSTPNLVLNYRLYWTKMATDWGDERRRQLRAAVAEVIGQPDFVDNTMARRYTVPELDNLAHAGASLLALRDVLDGLLEYDQQEART